MENAAATEELLGKNDLKEDFDQANAIRKIKKGLGHFVSTRVVRFNDLFQKEFATEGIAQAIRHGATSLT